MDDNAYSKMYGWSIRIYSGKHQNSQLINSIRWEYLRFDLIVKYQWYFEYRYALLRIKYPKNKIISEQLNFEMRIIDEIDSCKSKLVSAKRNYTKNKNLLEQATLNWNKLFPKEEDSIYKQANSKVLRLKDEVDSLEVKLKELLKKNDKS